MAQRFYPRFETSVSGGLSAISLAGITLLVVAAFATIAFGQEKQAPAYSADDLEFFEKKVRPILAERCFECHGPKVDEPEGHLHMVSREALLTGGETGPAIQLEKPAESLLIESINYEGLYEMPPDSKLPAEEIKTLTEWVERGAPWPAAEEAASLGPKKFDLDARRREHWCWQPISNPTPPAVPNTQWIRQPLDAFVLAELDKHQIAPAAEADKQTLVRRLYLDLIGLPPTPTEVDQFIQDKSPNAYEKLVDRLLASPRFGEHWARHWMDLVRYAETYGHEYDYPIPHAYEYRDYLIRAFNADIPYDQFIREHVAGDLLPQPRLNPDDQFNESIIATGYWFLGEATHGPVDVRGDEAGRIDNQIDVFGKTFLGLTVACARCHDHMFDAIATRDYYGLVGFLQSSRRQLAMLDYGEKIESAHKSLRQRQTELDAKLAEYRQILGAAPPERSEMYLSAALECLSKYGPFSAPELKRFQGEAFANGKPTGGHVLAQELAAEGDRRWDGDKQLWWIDAKVGDRLAIEFNVAADGQYDVVADFTKARDYGIVKVLIDGDIATAELDLFATELGKTGEQVLTNRSLASGKHALEFEIIGTNKDAVPKLMFGLDYFELRPKSEEIFGTLAESINEVAKANGLDATHLSRWVQALRDPRFSKPDHPLHSLQHVLQSGGLSDSKSRGTALAELKQRRDAARAAMAESVPFADFNDPKLPGWSRTGWAFDDTTMPAWSIDISIPGQLVGRWGTTSSGRKGTPLYGVLRSPTFTLDHKFIHYRIAGRDAQVRVIIDGFTLDTFNSLLFNGITQTVDSPDQFVWLSQGQDVGNYLGHRAHLEIIDHSGGSIAIDEIRLSDQPTLPDVPSDFAERLLEVLPSDASLDSAKQISTRRERTESAYTRFADQLWLLVLEQIAADEPGPAGPALLDWLYRWDLVDDPATKASRESIEAQLADRQEWLQKNRVPTPVFAQAICDGTGENEFVFIRGNHRTLGPEAQRRMIEAIPTSEPFELSPESGSGRVQLANAVASTENPLTTRVVVNRLWHHLFGRGLVASVDNFGVLGERPSHPELLDHLARTFAQQGWSIKQMLRTIALSSTYRMSSQMNAAAEQADPDNRLLHRANVRRLTSESIRDSILHVAGNLDTKMYGPSVPIYLTPFMEGRGRPGESGPLDGNRRRSVYIEVRRNFLAPMMLTFDTPSPFNAIGRRNVSNVPSQALMLLNHPFVVQQAEIWAQKILAASGDDDERLIALFQQAYARDPRPEELQLSREFLESQRRQLVASGSTPEQSESDAWRDLCHVLFNAKEFYYVH